MYKRLRDIRTLTFVLAAISSCTALGDILTLRYFQVDSRYDYRIELLKLALDNTQQQFGPYQLVPVDKYVTQGRGEQLLQEGEFVNIAFLPTNKNREQTLLPIRIPILRGILGYRVFLIHRGNQPRFANIQTLDQLSQNYVAGFGEQWADMSILRNNGLKALGVVSYESLFSMLAYKRFDYFPRGLNEAWKELEEKSEQYPQLMVEEHLALYYPYPVYFFVNQHDTVLANRIEEGLQIALRDGSFKHLFLQYHQGLVDQANLHKRMVFSLTNHSIPADTAMPDTSWWLKN